VVTDRPISSSVTSIVRTFDDDYAPVIRPPLRQAIDQRLATLGPCPVVCEHRDFSPWNVCLGADGGALVVFDWESAVRFGIPALDLIYFLSHLAAEASPGRLDADSYRAAWAPSTVVGRANRDCVAMYVESMGIEPGSVPALRLLTWMLHARSEYQRLVEDTGTVSEAQLRRALFYTLVEQEAMDSQAQ